MLPEKEYYRITDKARAGEDLTPEEFSDACHQTLSDNFNGNQRWDLTGVIDVLEEFVWIGKEKLDPMKKSFFYKHNPEGVGEFLSTLDEMDKTWERSPWPSDIEEKQQILHAILGIATEAVELVEALIVYLQTGQLDMVNVGEEVGDLNWYIAILAKAGNLELAAILRKLVLKLEKRYKGAFTTEAALNRDLDTERRVLEQNV